MEPALGVLALGEVANKPGKERLARLARLADRELHGEGAAVAALTDDHAADADDASLAARAVTREIAVVLFPIRLGHQELHVLTAHLISGVAEQPLGGRAEE